MKNASGFVKIPGHQDQNSPQKDDKDSIQLAKITIVSLDDGDDDKEVPPGDGILPAAERVEKDNGGGGDGEASQFPTRKRARNAGGEESWENQRGGGGGDHPVVEGPMKLTPCPWQGCGKSFGTRRALFMHVSAHINRPWLGPSAPPLLSREEGKREDKEEKGGESGEVALPVDDGEPAGDTRGGAFDEAPKVAGVDIDLNVAQFLVPDLNLSPPPEHRG